MKSLVTCISATQLPPSAPAEIVFIPEGENTINPFVDGKAKKITVRVPAHKGHEIAARMQTALQRRQGNTVRPFLDFEHKNGSASALPKSFRYESGKGIMLALDWTGAGKAAIEGRDFSYFSPTFLIDDQGEPSDLPDKGAVGALVNEPAFRNLERIAASHAGREEMTGQELLLKALQEEAGETLEEVKAAAAVDSRLEGLSGEELLSASFAIEAEEAAGKVRKDTLRKLKERGKGIDPGPHAKLTEYAIELLESGKAEDDEEAMQLACEAHPLLFQQWQDQLPKGSATVKGASADDFPGLTGAALLQAALAAEMGE